MGLMASDEATRRRMERFLAPPAMDRDDQNVALRAVHAVNGDTKRFDFVLCEPGMAGARGMG